MTLYLVFVCPRCGLVRYAKKGQNTAKCFKCGYQVPLNNQKTRILRETVKVEEAIEFVQRYKMRIKK